MPMHIDQTTNTGNPPGPALVVAVFESDPNNEALVYFDGVRYGPSSTNWVAAMCGIEVGQRLPFYRRHWGTRGPVLYWRRVTIDPSSVGDAFRQMMGG